MTEQLVLTEVARDYKSTLSDLTMNSKPMITMLTMLADENKEHASDIVNVLINYSKMVSPAVKLPVMYLIDSIIKNVGGEYKRLLTISIVNIFASAFKSMDESNRRKMYDLRQTWNELFAPSRLYLLDATIKEMDPAWPINVQNSHSKSSTANIHVNPNFKGSNKKHAHAAGYTPKRVVGENFPKAFTTEAKNDKPNHHSKTPKVPIPSFSKVDSNVKDRKVSVPPAQPPIDKHKIFVAPWKAKEIIPHTSLKVDIPVSIKDPRTLQKHVNRTDPRLVKSNDSGLRDPRLMKKISKSDLFGAQLNPKLVTSKPFFSENHKKLAEFTSKVTSTPVESVYSVDEKVTNDSQEQQPTETSNSSSLKSKEPHQRETRKEKSKDKVKETEITPKSSRREHHRRESRHSESGNKLRRDSDERTLKKEEMVKEAAKHKPSVIKGSKHEVLPIPKYSAEIMHKKTVTEEVVIPAVPVANAEKSQKLAKNKPEIFKPIQKFVGKIPKISQPNQRKSKEVKSIAPDKLLQPSPPPQVEAIKHTEPDVPQLKETSSPEKKQPMLAPQPVLSSKIENKASRVAMLALQPVSSSKIENKSSRVAMLAPQPVSSSKIENKSSGVAMLAPQPVLSSKMENKSSRVVSLFGTEDIDLRTLSLPKAFQNVPELPIKFPESMEKAVLPDKVRMEHVEAVSHIPSEDNIDIVEEFLPKTRRLSVQKPNSASWEKFRDKDPKYKEYHRQASISDKPEYENDPRKRSISMEWESENEMFRDKEMRDMAEPEERNYKLFALELNDQMKNKQITLQEYNQCMRDIWQMNENNKIQMLRRQEGTQRNYRQEGPSQSISRSAWRSRARHSVDTVEQNSRSIGSSKNVDAGSVWLRGSQSDFNENQFHETQEEGYYDQRELPGLSEDVLKSVNRNSVSHKMTIDKVVSDIRSYGDKAIILLNWDDPRFISFKPTTCNVFFEEADLTLELRTGDDYKEFYLCGHRHQIKLGVPTQELFIDGKGYQCFFGMQPIVIYLNGKHHSVGLSGRPPQVDISPERNTSYLVGKIEMIIDAKRVIGLYLDAMPQKFHIDGRAVLLKFIDSLQAVNINGIIFPIKFDSLPFSITVRGYRRFIRFSALPEDIIPGKVGIKGMDTDGSNLIPFYPTNLPQLSPERMPFDTTANDSNLHLQTNAMASNSLRENEVVDQRNTPQEFTSSTSQNNYVHASNMAPASYQSENVTQSQATPSYNAPLDISSILNSLVMSGVIKDSVNATSSQEETQDNDELIEEETFDYLPTTAALWTSKTLKTRNNDLINKLVKGLQCSSCGLRFTASRTPLYSAHLDWHYRRNKKENESTKKANYRKFFLISKDWEVYEEIEDVDERAPSMFEMEKDTNGDKNSEENEEENIPSVMVFHDKPSLGVCPVCHETFDQYFDDETEDWRYRYAISVEEANYHPGCHADLLKQIEKAKAAEKQKEDEERELEALRQEEEEKRKVAEKEAEEIKLSAEREKSEAAALEEKANAEKEKQMQIEEEIKVAAEIEKQKEQEKIIEAEKERQKVLEEEKRLAAEKEKQEKEKRVKERLEEMQRKEADRKKKEEENRQKLLTIEKEKLILIEKLEIEKRKLAEKEESESKRRKIAQEEEKIRENNSKRRESMPIISVRHDMEVDTSERISLTSKDASIGKQTNVCSNTTGDIATATDVELMDVDDPFRYPPAVNNDQTSADMQIDVNIVSDHIINGGSNNNLPISNNFDHLSSMDATLAIPDSQPETISAPVSTAFGGIRIKDEPSDIAEVLPPPIPLLLADLPIKIEVEDEPEEDEDIAIVEEIEEPEIVPPVITNILQSSIDGNTELSIPISEPVKSKSAGPIIRINVSKRHMDSIPEQKTEESKNSNSSEEPIEKFVPPPFTFDPSKKPLFKGAQLIEQPTYSRGMEISSLCSIM